MVGDENHVEKRVGELERRTDSHESQIADLGRRFGSFEVAQTELSTAQKELASAQKELAKSVISIEHQQIRTQTLVEVGNKKTDELSSRFISYVDSEFQRRENERKEKDRRHEEIELAKKARTPNWWLVLLTVALAIVALASLIYRMFSTAVHP